MVWQEFMLACNNYGSSIAVAANGEIIAASEGYKAKLGCLNGIESVKNNTIWSETEEVKK